MKKLNTNAAIFSLIVGIAILAARPSENSAANVNRVNGLYVFTDSYPAAEYEVIGQVKTTISLSTQYQDMRNKAIRKVKDRFPYAEAIIIYPNNKGSDKIEAIKFK